MRKKVGIITYPDIADGKGRFLQAYALYSAISEQGYEVEIIDYRKKQEETKWQRLVRHIKTVSVKDIIVYFYVKKERKRCSVISEERKKQRKEYENFIANNINMSMVITNHDELKKYAKKFDAIVCGSDQIWNPYYWGKDSAYYASFVEPQKRISYAASIGTTEVDDKNMNVIGNYIGQMKFVSVREESASEMLKSKCGVDATVVVDPTFMMSSDWWNEYASEERVLDGKYILTFFFDNGTKCRDFAKKLSEKHNMPIINIPETSMDLTGNNTIFPCLSPKGFASLFRNAEYVITQSFHGVVLSIIFRRKFFVLDRETNYNVSGLISRINDMLHRFGLEKRIINGTEELTLIDEEIDYDEKYKIINQKAEEGRQYLNTAIEEVISCK